MRVTQTIALLMCGIATVPLMPAPVAAQQAGSSLRGVVLDAEGAPVPGAAVTIEDQRSGRVEVATTSSDGRFVQTGLAAAGPYKVSVIGEDGVQGSVSGITLIQRGERFVRVRLGRSEVADGRTAVTDPSAAEDAPIVVRGSRGEISSSLGVERNADGIMSAASSDAIGRFADENAAEAARRLPGVSIINNRGEGRFVTVRGAEPTFVGFSVNGINLPSQEDDRSVALDVIPSEQLARIEVFKSLTAAQDAEGIGGRVNLVTKSPLDFQDGITLAEGAIGWNEQNEDRPWRASGTFGRVFGPDREFGVLISGSYSSNPRGFESAEADDWDTEEFNGVEGWYTEGVTYQDRLFTNDRFGISGTLQWRPSEAVDIEIGALYNASNLDEVRQRIQFQFDDPADAGPLGEGGTFTSVTYPNSRTRRRFDYVDTDRETWSAYGGARHDLDGVVIDYRVSYSVANEVSYGPEISFRSGRYDVIAERLDTQTPLVTATDGFDVNDPTRFGYNESGVRTFDRDDEEWAGEANLALELGPDLLRFGGKVRLREKANDTQRIRQDEFLNGDLTLADLVGSPPDQDSLDYDYVIGVDREAALALLADTGAFNAEDRSFQDSLLDDFTVEEDIYAGYVQYELVRGPLQVIPGLRVEHTKTRSTFIEDRSDGRDVDDPTRYQAITLEREYTDFFPSVNVRYDASSSLVLRAAATRSISRPRFGDLAGAREVDFENFLDDPTEPIEISEGNPNLDATYSINLDASASWYFSPASVLQVSVFHKEIDGPIYDQRFDETFEGNAAEVRRPVNAGNARITGVEFGYTQQFTFLPGALSGFGVNTNLTLIDSSVDVPERPGEEFPLFNQSDMLANASLIYQYGGFDGQISLNYRGEMLTGLEDTDLDEFQRDYLTLDARIEYAFNDRFIAYIAATNLTDEPEQTFAGRRSRLLGNEYYGRNVLVGMELNFGG